MSLRCDTAARSVSPGMNRRMRLLVFSAPAICIEARHAQKVLNETLNKTDSNDADGLAQLAETGFFKSVRVKSFDAMLTRALVVARHQLLNLSKQLGNQSGWLTHFAEPGPPNSRSRFSWQHSIRHQVGQGWG